MLPVQTAGYLLGPLLGGVLSKHINVRYPFYVGILLVCVDFGGRLFIRPSSSWHQYPRFSPFPEPSAAARILRKAGSGVEVVDEGGEAAPSGTEASDQSTTITEQASVPGSIHRSDSDDHSNCGTPPKRAVMPGVIPTIFNGQVIVIGIVSALASSTICALDVIVPSLVEDRFGGDEELTSYVMLSYIVPGMCMDVLSGYVCDRLGDGRSLFRIIAFSMLMHALAVPAFSFAETLPVLALTLALFGATSSFVTTPMMTEVGLTSWRITPIGCAPSNGLLYAVNNEYYYVGMIIGPILIPFFESWWKSHFLSVGIFSLLHSAFAVVYYVFMKWYVPSDRSAPSSDLS
jgi:MFS family permease